MKFLHTSDLHLGKSVHEFSMRRDQEVMLSQIMEIARAQEVDAIIVAGDVYDRAIPSAQAVTLLDDFLEQVRLSGIRLLLISGNHDSPERLQFAEKILEQQGIYIAGNQRNREGVRQVYWEDNHGQVCFVLLPFEKPGLSEVRTCQESVSKSLQTLEWEENTRYVCVTHYFVTNEGKEPILSDSETTVCVGGIDNIEASLFSKFDYTALGHIHRTQQIGNKPIYYAGAPLSYSFSEAGHEKSVRIVTLEEKGRVEVETVPLKPLHEMRKIKGRIDELTRPEIVKALDANDYIQVTLTDEEELVDPIGRLRAVYPNVMQMLLAKNQRKDTEESLSPPVDISAKSMRELFAEFYSFLRGSEMDEERTRVLEEVIRQVEEG